MCVVMFLVFLTFLSLSHGGEPFSPFKDDILFRINWPGSKSNVDGLAPPGFEYTQEDTFVVTSADNERYRCSVPSVMSSDSDQSKGDVDNAKTAHELLAPVFKTAVCTYNIHTYWTYEVCHGKHIRQYHEERVRKPNSKDQVSTLVLKTENGKEIVIQQEDDKNDLIKTTEFFLGHMQEKVDKSGLLLDPGTLPTKPEEVPRKKINGVSTPYYAVNLTDGTPCDLKSGSGRKSTILYICGPDSRNDLLTVTETSSCEYELVVLTPVLCSNPFYTNKRKQVNEIQCIALDDSPLKPTALTRFNSEQSEDIAGRFLRSDGDASNRDEPTKNDMRRIEPTTISSIVDKSLLEEFLSGSYCLRGGSGWWRFEYCYGIHVTQYHDDKKSGRTTILVGEWDEAEHKAWCEKKTSKPVTYKRNAKGENEVLQIAHFYGNGDVCDNTGKPREVIVRMKCKKDASSPHSVTIYMLEPTTCSYILGVESLIFCDLLDSADVYGLVSIDT